MKIRFALHTIMVLGMLSCETKQSSNTSTPIKPNIILINIDDLGWGEPSFMGSTFYETPVIDDLSMQSVIFTNAYAAAANCAPSRASLMTGKWTQRHGILTVGSSERGKSEDRKLIPTANKTEIDEKFLLIPELLKKGGYHTIHAGKWHLSNDPLQNGFAINIGGSHAGHPSSYHAPFKNIDLKAEKGERLTGLIMDELIQVLETNKEPFFVNYAPYAVHTPIQPVDSLLAKYHTKEKIPGKSNPSYATMIEDVDANIGKLISHLKQTNQFKNTVIIFTSDNGGLFFVSNQHPLRAGKGSYYEGGIRVPFFIVWKDKIDNGIRNNTPISNIDIYPTLLEIANIDAPRDLILDGNSLYPVLTKKKKIEERPLFWHFPVYLQAVAKENENRDSKFRTRPGSVIRYGKWKLHHYFEDDAIELYNLEDDLGEKNNLVDSLPEKTKELFNLLEQWRADTNAPVPNKLNPEYLQSPK
ncbi:sulfatase [Flagellimonas pacifica]|uniref:Arylsulfatase A n=1 Tax=Flagellimonas pacifica TaxID=1247520 RepID=A0A285MV95_9FLAO|nr:sulfatase [Allomuricauda parva]SNZ00457.1 Arylsulfatase A [Allomuricauda parva]